MFCTEIVSETLQSVQDQFREADDALEAAENRRTARLNRRVQNSLGTGTTRTRRRRKNKRDDDHDDSSTSSDEQEDDQTDDDDEGKIPPEVITVDAVIKSKWRYDPSQMQAFDRFMSDKNTGLASFSLPEMEVPPKGATGIFSLGMCSVNRNSQQDQQQQQHQDQSASATPFWTGLHLRCFSHVDAVFELVHVSVDAAADMLSCQQQRQQQKQPEKRYKKQKQQEQQNEQEELPTLPPLVVRARCYETPPFMLQSDIASRKFTDADSLAVCTLASSSSPASPLGPFSGARERIRLNCAKDGNLVIDFMPLFPTPQSYGVASSTAAPPVDFTVLLHGHFRIYKAWPPSLRAIRGSPQLMLRSWGARPNDSRGISDDGCFPPTRPYVAAHQQQNISNSSNNNNRNTSETAAAAATTSATNTNNRLVASTHNPNRIPLQCQRMRSLPVVYAHLVPNSEHGHDTTFVLDASELNRDKQQPRMGTVLPTQERRRQREEERRTGINPQSPAAWASLLAIPAGDVFERRYTPASAQRPVHIRRFPHRNADIIGRVEFGKVAIASGVVYDERDKEWYVEWAYLGGFSRLRGSLGPFLIQLWPGRETTVLDPPRFFGTASETKTVRVRNAPCRFTGDVVAPDLQTNEVRAAVALHSGIDQQYETSVFVEWADGSGFSRKSGQLFVPVSNSNNNNGNNDEAGQQQQQQFEEENFTFLVELPQVRSAILKNA